MRVVRPLHAGVGLRIRAALDEEAMGEGVEFRVLGSPGAVVIADGFEPSTQDVEAVPQFPRQVVRGEDRFDPRSGQGRRRVDRDDVGASVIGQVERRVAHAGDADVVDVAPVAERERRGLVLCT